METNTALTIRGDLDLIYSYAAGVERWPDILPHYRSVRIIEQGERVRLVNMHCVREFGVLHWPCKWRAWQELRPEEGRILYSHVSGPARGMEVEWLLKRMPDGVLTTIRHWVNSNRHSWARFYWNRIIGPVFVQAIATQTLTTIKQLVEGEARA